jgi:hypothetical protein
MTSIIAEASFRHPERQVRHPRRVREPTSSWPDGDEAVQPQGFSHVTSFVEFKK